MTRIELLIYLTVSTIAYLVTMDFIVDSADHVEKRCSSFSEEEEYGCGFPSHDFDMASMSSLLGSKYDIVVDSDFTNESDSISVDDMSDILVEDVSDDDLSDFDDSDSCFSACLAKKGVYIGPVDCTLDRKEEGVPVEKCAGVSGAGNRSRRNVNATNGSGGNTNGRSRGNSVGTSRSTRPVRSTSTRSGGVSSTTQVTNRTAILPSGFVSRGSYCHNCQRDSVAHGPDYYRLTIRVKRVKMSSFRRKFSTYTWQEITELLPDCHGYVSMRLCGACAQYLTSSNYNQVSALWPAMIWNWLSDARSIRQRGDKLWGLIPLEWRPWWLRSVGTLHSAYQSVTLHQPPSVFADVTLPRDELHEAIDGNEGVTLANACNKHLHATVWCPWGESEYLHKCGHVPLDVVVSNLFGDSVRTISGNARKDLEKVTGVLRDFLDGNYVHLLGNPEWAVRPSISFVNGAPVVLTCRKHDRGCKADFFHLPRNPKGILPSWQSDQLTPAVVRPRTLKQLKVHKFSDSYQMHEMQGQFNGVDTVRVCEHHDFLTDSKIIRDKEEVSLSGRRDLRALVGEWEQDGTLPSDVARARLADARQYGATEEQVEKYCRGATFMTLHDSLKVQGMNKSRQSRVITVQGTGAPKEQHFVPPWPACLVNVHPYDEFGAGFPLLPKMYDAESDIRLAFYLVAMHAVVPALWEGTNACIQSEESWEGWLLAYVANKCFPSSTVSPRNNPFTFVKLKKQKACLQELLVRLGMRKGPLPQQPPATANAVAPMVSSPPHASADEEDDSTSDALARSSALRQMWMIGRCGRWMQICQQNW